MVVCSAKLREMTKAQLLFAYKNMLLAREFDHALINLYRQSKIVGGVYAQIGNEASSVGTAMALGDGDIIFPMHRDNGAHFVRRIRKESSGTGR